MNSSWYYSLNTEIERIGYLTKSLAKGIYTKLGFYILPYINSNHKDQTVFIPDLKFNTIKNFWNKMRKAKEVAQFKTIASDDVISSIKFNLERSDLMDNENVSSIIEEWNKKEDSFFNYLNDLILFKGIKVEELIIRPTQYGTVSSYSFITDNKIRIFLRQDCDISHLAEAVITSFVHNKFYSNLQQIPMMKNREWLLKELIADFFLTDTQLSDLFPNYTPTYLILKRKKDPKLTKETNHYLKKLGITNLSLAN